MRQFPHGTRQIRDAGLAEIQPLHAFLPTTDKLLGHVQFRLNRLTLLRRRFRFIRLRMLDHDGLLGVGLAATAAAADGSGRQLLLLITRVFLIVAQHLHVLGHVAAGRAGGQPATFQILGYILLLHVKAR